MKGFLDPIGNDAFLIAVRIGLFIGRDDVNVLLSPRRVVDFRDHGFDSIPVSGEAVKEADRIHLKAKMAKLSQQTDGTDFSRWPPRAVKLRCPVPLGDLRV